MFLLGLLAELETMLIVELDSVSMLLDDSTDDELFTGRAPPRWLLAIVDFIDDELATSLLLDSTDDFTLELLLLLLLETSLELDFLLDKLFTLELFALLLEILLELDFLLDELLMLELFLLLDTADDFTLELFTLELEAFFDEALLDALLELFTELLIELDFLLELFKLELFTGRLPPR